MAHWSPNDIVGCAPSVAKEFILFCAGQRVNKRSRIALDRPRKAFARIQWPRRPTNCSKQAFYVWLGMRPMALPQAAVPIGENTIAVMRADGHKLVHAGRIKQSRLSIADQGALQLRKVWRSIVRRGILVSVDSWWHAQLCSNPVKPNVYLDITAIVVLHTTPLPLFLGHPSLHDLAD